MRVLVTGAAGFIGSHVVDLLIKEGHEILCLDDLSSGLRSNLPEKIDFAEVNVGNWYDLVSEFHDFEPEAVIHLAAQPSICDSFDNPIRDGYVNVMGTLNVIRACQKIGTQRLVFSSTSAVYSETDSVISEDFPRVPQTPYGISKLAAESYIRLLMSENSVVMRFGNVYGPGQVPLGENQVVPRMIRHFEKGAEFVIHGDGQQIRDLVYVDDVAKACVASLTGTPGVYNIASGHGTRVNEIADFIGIIYEVPAYAWEHDDQQDPRYRVVLNISKANFDLSWKPTVSLSEGLRRTVEWWKAQ